VFFLNSIEIGLFLENLRYGRKLSQEDFISGVVSMRQYQRYRNGQCEITYDKLEQFAEKLGIPTKKLLAEFEKEKSNRSHVINLYYNAVVNRDLVRAKELKVEVEKNKLVDEDQKLLFAHANMVEDHLSGKISREKATELAASAIGFPAVLKQKYLTDIEVLVLGFLLTVIEGEDQKKLLRKMSQLFENDEFILSNQNNNATSLILIRMAKMYGSQKDFSQVVRLCDIGIKRGNEATSIYLMEFFFYYKALAHFRLESFDLFEDSLFRCYNVLHLEGNKKKIEKFTGLIEKDFHINFDGFVMNYLKKRIL
jgi:transcriptional regulator with XRE-family HTH domain